MNLVCKNNIYLWQTFFKFANFKFAESYIFHWSMHLIDMCESSSKDTVVAVLSHIGFSAVLHNTVVDNACDVHQSRLDSISWSYYKYSITWSIQ